MTTKKKTTRTVLRVLRSGVTLAVTALVIGLLLRRLGGGWAFASVVRSANPAWVGVALLASGACVLLGTQRWRLVLAAMGYDLPFWRTAEVVLATWPLAVVTPSRANDLLRPLAVRDVVPLAAGTGSVFAEKAVDLFVLLVFAAAGAAVQGAWAWAVPIAGLGVFEAAVIAAVVLQGRRLERLPLLRARRKAVEELFGALVALRRAPGLLPGQVLTSLGIRLSTVTIVHTLLLSVGADIPFCDTLTLFPSAVLVGLAPLTFAGVGTRDAAFLQLLAERGIRAAPVQVLAATVGYSAVAFGFIAVIGLPFMVRELTRASALPSNKISRPPAPRDVVTP